MSCSRYMSVLGWQRCSASSLSAVALGHQTAVWPLTLKAPSPGARGKTHANAHTGGPSSLRKVSRSRLVGPSESGAVPLNGARRCAPLTRKERGGRAGVKALMTLKSNSAESSILTNVDGQLEAKMN